MISDDEIRALLEPMIVRRTRFIACERPARDVLVATRFGGRPAGLRGESWPMCTCGDPLKFVGQISGIDAPMFVSWFQLATVFYCGSCRRYGEQDFGGPERPWAGWCVRAYPPSRCDEDSLLVYADWLQSRGDPNGELIALALAIESARDAGERDARRHALNRFLLSHVELPEPAAWDGPQLDGDRDEFALLALPDLAHLEVPEGAMAEAEFLYAEGFVRPVRELSLPDETSLQRMRALDAARGGHDPTRIERIAYDLTGRPGERDVGRGRLPMSRNAELALGGYPRWFNTLDDTPTCARCGDAMELFVQFDTAAAAATTTISWETAPWGDSGIYSFVCAVHRDHYAFRWKW